MAEARKDIDFLSFDNSPDWEDWLTKNHDMSSGVRLRLFKKGSGKASLGHKEALEIALMFGWIDSVLNNYDQESYLLRFTPRRTGSHWSQVNLETAKRLIAEGRMTEAGMKALGDLDERHLALQDEVTFDHDLDSLFMDDPETLAAFNTLPPSHRRTYGRYVLSAKRQETRARRMERVAPMIRERRPPLL